MNDASALLRKLCFSATVAVALPCVTVCVVHGQAAPAASTQAAARQHGTVKTISGTALTLTTDDGQQLAVAVSPSAKIVQLAPGSTDLKAAQPITLGDISVGDRILVVGAAGTEAGSFAAGRVILMKSTDIAAQHVREEADWQRRGVGGLVGSIDVANHSLVMTVRGKVVEVKTTTSTVFRRYAGDSVKFEDAKRGSFEQVQTGDQIRVRGSKSVDGASIDAEEIVSGSFENVSGTLTAVDAAAGTVTLKDLATKRVITVNLTANSAIHVLPPDAAASLSARPATAGAGTGTPTSQEPAQAHRDGAAAGGAGTGGRRQSADLSQVVARLPTVTVAALHTGDAVLVVASPASPGSASVTAITLVSGVQSLLAAAQGNASAVTLSPWSLGGAPAEGGGGQ